MPLLIIYNPASGEGKAAGQVEDVKTELSAAGLQADFVAIDSADWQSDVRRAVDRGDALVVAAGGDGTINAVAGLLVGTNTALGVLPVGTLNHFAADAGIPTAVKEAVAVLQSGRDVPLDTADVNGQLFLNNSSVGLYPALVQRRERYGRLKKPLATLMAALEVLRRRSSLPASLTIGADLHTLRTPFIFVGNNDYELGRIGFIGRTSLTQGQLSVYVIRQTNLRGLLPIALRTFFGGSAERNFDNYLGTRLEVKVPRQAVQVAYDGEVRGMQPPLVWTSRPESLKVRVPA